MDNHDILVIGGGPAGSRVACNLAELGYHVMVFEKNKQAGEGICCTGIIGRECMDVFKISSGCILRAAKSARLFAPSGESLEISKDDVQAYIVDRIVFDRSLAERAQAAGAEYLPNSYVNDVVVTPDCVEVTVETKGNRSHFRGKAAIIANGFASPLPRKLGMGQIKKSIIGAQAEVTTCGIDEVEVYFSHSVAPGFFAWLVPISKRSARVGLFASKKPALHMEYLLRHLASQGKIIRDNASITYGGIPLKPLPRTYSERVLVVGDAAGQVKPTTGGGIYYGLLSADIASYTLHQAFSANDFSGRQLNKYEKRWKNDLGRELKIGYLARSLYNKLSDKRINSIFEIVRENNIHETLLNSSHVSFDWHGETILNAMKHLAPWRHVFGKYIPAYLLKMVR